MMSSALGKAFLKLRPLGRGLFQQQLRNILCAVGGTEVPHDAGHGDGAFHQNQQLFGQRVIGEALAYAASGW